jgi:four helix bundle protein
MIVMSEKNFLQLNDLSSYKVAFHTSNHVWNIIEKWDIFSKKTVGDQFVRSVDSISANIAEGFGRRTKKDKIKFYNYAYASTLEALDWNEKAYRRKLISKSQYENIIIELKKLPREINTLSNFTERKLKK